MTTNKGLITADQLKSLVASGEIDTVVVAFTDVQGRLVGKRVAARLFIEDIMDHGAECCNYLLTVDVENNTVDGYSFASGDPSFLAGGPSSCFLYVNVTQLIPISGYTSGVLLSTL